MAVVTLSASADLARAQVFIDPGSPSGKEYEIPLETVRRGAQPGTDPSAPVTQGERSAAPFGEGIGGDAAAAGVNTGGASEDGKAGGRGDGQEETGDAGASDSSTTAIVDAAATNPGAPSSSTGSTLLYVGAGALVLALGACGGMLLRRRT